MDTLSLGHLTLSTIGTATPKTTGTQKDFNTVLTRSVPIDSAIYLKTSQEPQLHNNSARKNDKAQYPAQRRHYERPHTVDPTNNLAIGSGTYSHNSTYKTDIWGYPDSPDNKHTHTFPALCVHVSNTSTIPAAKPDGTMKLTQPKIKGNKVLGRDTIDTTEVSTTHRTDSTSGESYRHVAKALASPRPTADELPNGNDDRRYHSIFEPDTVDKRLNFSDDAHTTDLPPLSTPYTKPSKLLLSVSDNVQKTIAPTPIIIHMERSSTCPNESPSYEMTTSWMKGPPGSLHTIQRTTTGTKTLVTYICSTIGTIRTMNTKTTQVTAGTSGTI